MPHTPDLHATTIHPDPPATPHPDGPGPSERIHEGQPAPARTGSEAPAVDRTVHVDAADVPGSRTPFANGADLLPNTRYDVPGRASYFTDATGQINHVEATSGGAGGRLNPDLQRPLPNATYVVDHNYTFHTDEVGRTHQLHTDALPTDAAAVALSAARGRRCSGTGLRGRPRGGRTLRWSSRAHQHLPAAGSREQGSATQLPHDGKHLAPVTCCASRYTHRSRR